ncbi:MAG: trigger factor [Chitinivibrionales bacterium]|nr:trigger factor [Chitinivibrionales bacterium]MBD3358423.1 trigger factor [Chitinivibrionales bacterium]
MKATVSQPEAWQRRIEVEVPEEEVKGAFEEKVKKYRRDIKLPGFRPGKVPGGIIKARYGPAIRAEVVEELVQQSYERACQENNIEPVGLAKVHDLNAEEGTPLSFTVDTEVDPEIEIKGYDKLKIRPTPKKIKQDQVNEALGELQDRMSSLIDVDRPSQKGDFLTIEYVSVIVDGEPRTDLRNPQYPVELGRSNIKEVDKGLTGHTAGEVVDLSVKFPRNHSDEYLAGKSSDMKIRITKVQEKRMPELNEEFLREMGDFDSVDALKESIREDLEKKELERAKNEAYNKVIDTLIKNNPFEVPPARIERYIDYMAEEAAKYSRDEQPPSREEIEQKYHESAVRTFKRRRIIDYIADKEKIKATQEEVDNQIRRMAEMYDRQFDELKQVFRRNGTTNRIRADIREQKTLDFLTGEPAKD